SRHNLFVNGQATAAPALYQEQAVAAGLNRERAGQGAAHVGRQIELLQRCPDQCLADPPHAHAAHERDQDDAHEPNGNGPLPFPPSRRAPPFVAHGCLPAEAVNRASAFSCFSWSARSISRCIVSAVTAAPLHKWKWRLSRIVRRAMTSASTVASAAGGSAAFRIAARTHSLTGWSPASV